MTARFVALFGTVIGLMLVQACSSLPRQLASPRVEIVELQLLQTGFDGQRFAVRLMLENPNAIAIPVRLLEFDIRLGGEGLLEGASSAPFLLPANGSQAVEVEIFSNLVSSATRLLALVQGPGNALEYEIQGRLTLDVSFRDPIGFYQRGQVPLIIPQVSR
jgi:LEA14-like dessication related protein